MIGFKEITKTMKIVGKALVVGIKLLVIILR